MLQTSALGANARMAKQVRPIQERTGAQGSLPLTANNAFTKHAIYSQQALLDLLAPVMIVVRVENVCTMAG